MKTKETSNEIKERTTNEIIKVVNKSTREQAIAWWNDLSRQQREQLYLSYYGCKATNKFPDEIEEIWKRENQSESIDFNDIHQRVTEFSDEIDQMSKPNQKQFKKFDKDLFNKYTDKLDDEGILQAHNILLDKVIKMGYSEEQLKANIHYKFMKQR